MRIICLIDSLGSGGAQRQLVGLSKLLKVHGYEVKVLWYHNNDFYRSFLDENNISYDKISVSSKIDKISLVYKKIKDFKTDLVIAYIDGPTVITSILHLFDKSFKLIVSERNTTQKLTIKEYIKFYLYRWADAIIPNSYSQEMFIGKYFPNLKNKVCTITNFTDTDDFSPKKDLAKIRNICKLLVVGRIVEQKNVIAFLCAIKKVIDSGIVLQIDWYGQPYNKEYFQKCLNLKEKLGLDCITFHPATNKIKDIYQKADVFCLPSLFEGFPNVVCEAMSSGLPILCGNVCDNAKIVEHGVNGFLFNPNIVEDISAKIIDFVNLSKQQKDEMGNKSRELAIAKFSQEVFINKYINIIENL